MFIITSNIEYEEIMNILHQTHRVPKYGAANIQWMELTQAVEDWERKQSIKTEQHEDFE